MKLNLEQAEAILLIEGGADVYGYSLAKSLREMERAKPRAHKKYFTITKAMQAPENGAERQPYFGAIATKLGAKEAIRIIKEARRASKNR